MLTGHFYIPFSSIVVIFGQWEGEYEGQARLFRMKILLDSDRSLPPLGLVPAAL